MICNAARNKKKKKKYVCVWVDNTAAIAVATENDFTHEIAKRVTVKVRFR